MRLYYHPLSGHSHRARLFLSLAEIPHELVLVDLAKKGHKTPEFLELNRFGQLPVLDDEGTIVPDSVAIMVYAAKKFGKRDWLPEKAGPAAEIQRWLSVAAGQIYSGPCVSRLIMLFGSKLDAEEAIGRAHAILQLLDAELAEHEWIALDHPTIADVALYSYIAAAPEGNVDLTSYAKVRTWLERVESLPHFVPFEKSAVGLAA